MELLSGYPGWSVVLGVFVVFSHQALAPLLLGRESTSAPSLRTCHPVVAVLVACLRPPSH